MNEELIITEKRFLIEVARIITENTEVKDLMKEELSEDLSELTNPLKNIDKIGFMENFVEHREQVIHAGNILERYKAYKAKGCEMIFVLTELGPGFKLKEFVARRNRYKKALKKRRGNSYMFG